MALKTKSIGHAVEGGKRTLTECPYCHKWMQPSHDGYGKGKRACSACGRHLYELDNPARQEMADAVLRGYNDGWRNKRARDADSAGRRARLHRALDCVMDRTGFGKDWNPQEEWAPPADGTEHGGCIMISGRWWPKDSKVAQEYLARTKAKDADGDTVQCENCNQQVPEDQAVHTRAYGWICKECKEKVRSGFGKDAGNFQEGDRVKVLYGSASGKNGVISQVSPSGGFYGVASQAGKHLGYFSESDLKLLRRGGE